MRAVKSVLVMAGALKRANPELREDIVLIRALRDSSILVTFSSTLLLPDSQLTIQDIPKFLADDIPLFMGILSDLFPGIALPDHDYGLLQEAIHNSLVEAGLQPVKQLITKVWCRVVHTLFNTNWFQGDTTVWDDASSAWSDACRRDNGWKDHVLPCTSRSPHCALAKEGPNERLLQEGVDLCLKPKGIIWSRLLSLICNLSLFLFFVAYFIISVSVGVSCMGNLTLPRKNGRMGWLQT